MTLRGRKFLLVLWTLLLLASTAAVWVWGLSQPPAAVKPVFPTRTVKQDPTKAHQGSSLASISKSGFSKHWERPLRRPLYDPPPPKPKPVVKPKPPPIRARLQATMVDRKDAAKSMALLRLNTGIDVFRKVGESIGGADEDVKILEIQAGLIKVQRGEQAQELKVDYLGN